MPKSGKHPNFQKVKKVNCEINRLKSLALIPGKIQELIILGNHLLAIGVNQK